MTGIEILPVLQGIGLAVSAIGAIQQGAAAKSAANFNAEVARNNAIASRQAAASDERRFRRQTLKRQGTLRAGGASLDLLEDSAMEEELEALMIRHGGEVQAGGLEASARVEKARGRAAQTAGITTAASTLLLGGTTIAEKRGLLD